LNIFDVINDVHPSKDEDNISRRSDLSRSCCVLYRSTTSFAISEFPFLSCVKSKLTNNPLERYIEIRLSNFFHKNIFIIYSVDVRSLRKVFATAFEMRGTYNISTFDFPMRHCFVAICKWRRIKCSKYRLPSWMIVNAKKFVRVPFRRLLQPITPDAGLS